jgi:hypothetical protein
MTENHGVPGSNPGPATLKVLGITNVGGRHFSVVTIPLIPRRSGHNTRVTAANRDGATRLIR